MIGRRRTGRPGLVGTMARTAVIAGTATAVSGNVAQRQMSNAQQQQQAQAQAQAEQQAKIQTQADVESMKRQMELLQLQQAAAAAPAVPAPAPVGAAGGGADLIAQLEQLGNLKAAGILSDAEFEAAKARILAG